MLVLAVCIDLCFAFYLPFTFSLDASSR